MKKEEKGFRMNFRKFKAATKNVPCSTKLPLYWSLVEDCVKNDKESEDFVRERWSTFTRLRIYEFEKKLENINS